MNKSARNVDRGPFVIFIWKYSIIHILFVMFLLDFNQNLDLLKIIINKRTTSSSIILFEKYFTPLGQPERGPEFADGHSVKGPFRASPKRLGQTSGQPERGPLIFLHREFKLSFFLL